MAILHQLVENVRGAAGLGKCSLHHHLKRIVSRMFSANLVCVITYTCKESSGVLIIPPHRVTRALGKEFDHRNTSSRSIWSAIARIAGLDTRIARIKSLMRFSSRFSSFIVRFWSVISVLSSANFCCWLWHSERNSRTQLWFFSSSAGMIKPKEEVSVKIASI